MAVLPKSSYDTITGEIVSVNIDQWTTDRIVADCPVKILGSYGREVSRRFGIGLAVINNKRWLVTGIQFDPETKTLFTHNLCEIQQNNQINKMVLEELRLAGFTYEEANASIAGIPPVQFQQPKR